MHNTSPVPLTGRDILQLSLQHKDGPLAFDLGASPVTGIHASCLAGLRKHYGLEEKPVKVHEPCQMLGFPEDDLLDALGVPTCGIFSPWTKFGYENKNWKEWKTPWGQIVLVGEGFQVDETESDVFIYPCGDRSVPPSGQMPKSGYFFDALIRQEPIDDATLRVEDNLEEFQPIAEDTLVSLQQQLHTIQSTGRGTVLCVGGTGFGDVGSVPGTQLRRPQGIRDIAEWYISTVTRRAHLHAIFERQLEIALANLQRVHDVLGNAIDVIYLCGTDFGTQQSLFCSVKSFRELWFRYYKAINDWVHTHTAWKTFKHSCGAIFPLIPALIECGFDILNPVQCSAAGMDPKRLKTEFGDQLVFWGGGIDTQKTLPFGTPGEVRDEVRERIDIFAPGGGFVFNTIHNIQALTPIENLAAMFEAVKSYS
ncbi:MAG: hypothetical protein FWH27_08800 [Planctomycetaceae bacterium]|nr:hypothetical protein [Planctomycetaceae bacterium]